MGSQRELIINGDKGKGLSPDQRKAAEYRGHDIIVRAGAGSGKTKTLVARYLLLLDENRDRLPSDIAAVTFTEKAGNEMRSRVRAEMSRLAVSAEDPDDKAYWTKQLNEMDNACIGTIHSLCGRILRAHPAEAGLDPKFAVMDETETELLRNDVVAEVLNAIAANEEFTPLLTQVPGDKLTKILTRMLKSRGDFNNAMAKPRLSTTECYREVIDRFLDRYQDFIEDSRTAITESAFLKEDKDGWFEPHMKDLINAYDRCTQNLKEAADPIKHLKGLYSVFNDWDSGKRAGITGAMNKSAKGLRNQLEDAFPFLADGKDLDCEAYDKALTCLAKLWPMLLGTYLKELDARDALDFDELQERALELLRANESVRELWAGKFLELMVDEYQDTNDNQAELFDLLDPKHDHLFAVGDKKQSIYGFRGTNVALFDKRAQSIKEHGGADLSLNTSYRPNPALLRAMNVMLEVLMDDDDLKDKEHYAAFEPMEPRPGAGVETDEPLIEVLYAEKKRDAEMLTRRLLELRMLGKLENWGDAAILFRSSKDFTRYETALAAADIPYVTVAGSGFYDRPEIGDVLNMLHAAEDPYNDMLTAGFLLSPVIAFTPGMLARLRDAKGEDGKYRSFWQTLKEDNGELFNDPEEREIAERGKAILAELNQLAGRKRVDEVLERLYAVTGYRDMLAGQETERGWLNLDKLLTDARSSEKVSVSEFLTWLDTVKDAGAREGEAPSANEGAVRLMTIHQAKGLEFKVTVIASADNSFTNMNRSPVLVSPEFGPALNWDPNSPQYLEARTAAGLKDKSEWLRILYVAATRAEERLIICGSQLPKTGTSDSWMRRVLGRISGGKFNGVRESVPVYYLTQEMLDHVQIGVPNVHVDREVPVDPALLQPLAIPGKGTKSEKNPYGMAVGSMVHKALELEVYRDPAALDSLLARMLTGNDQLTVEERESAEARVKKLLERFAASDICRRIESAEERLHEVPYTLTYKNGSAASGIIDLLIREGGSYTVIDFKTDALESEAGTRDAVDRYSGQLGRYRRALRQTLGTDPECGLCFLDDRGETRYRLVTDEPEPAPDYEFIEDVPEWSEDEPFFGE